ncbi:hypothetical protein N9R65_03445 [Opitutales bacterium]|nr:hypothetical protein [Opitutales bacterium]MDB2357654.1 hypothetical protein [Opitutales bacterium]MDB2682537.1 hypothetical protein [Opitutales bacterium]
MDWQSEAWNSLQTNVLNKQGIKWIRVMERNAKRQKHFHVILVLPWETTGEVRAGVDELSKEPQKHIDKFYSERLLEFTKELGVKLPRYGFGRWNVTPIRSLDAVANYVSKRIASNRQYYLKGDRARGCSKELRSAKGKIGWISPRSMHYRHACQYFAFANGFDTLDEIREGLGPKWCYYNSEQISSFADELLEGTTVAIGEYILPRLDHILDKGGTEFISPYFVSQASLN